MALSREVLLESLEARAVNQHQPLNRMKVVIYAERYKTENSLCGLKQIITRLL